MIQRIFHITWTVLAVVGIVALVIISVLAWRLSTGINDFQKAASELTRDDFVRLLDTLEQQVRNDQLRYEAQYKYWDWDALDFSVRWQLFHDYCDATGYVPNDYNWQRYNAGEGTIILNNSQGGNSQ